VTTYICSFSGGVSRLKPRQQRDPMAVLKALRDDPNVSTWDMGEHNLWKTIQSLKDLGYVKEIDVAYPWCKFEVTQLGIERSEKC